METSIKISGKTWKRLRQLKLTLDCKSIDEVIDKFFKLVTKYKLMGELREIRK